MDIKRFERFYKDHHVPLILFIKKMVGDEELAYDIASESFLRYWECKEDLDNKNEYDYYTKSRSWLWKTAKNICLNHIRQKSERRAIDKDIMPPPDQLVDSIEVKCELLNQIKKHIEQLPKECGKIFYLHCIEGCSYEEISIGLKIKIDTCRVQISRARKIIKTKLMGEYPEILRPKIKDWTKRRKRVTDRLWCREMKPRKDGTNMWGERITT